MAQTLTITLTDEGQVTVNGPLGEKVLCYGLLETARDVIQAYRADAQTKIVMPASGLVVPRN